MKKPNIKKIKCSIFQAKNETIERITKKINETQDIREKAKLAKDLLKEVEDLISCKDFDEKRLDCQICQNISKIRKEAGELILKVSQLKVN